MTAASPLADRLLASAEALGRRSGSSGGTSKQAIKGAQDEFPKLLSQLNQGVDKTSLMTPATEPVPDKLAPRPASTAWLYQGSTVASSDPDPPPEQTGGGEPAASPSTSAESETDSHPEPVAISLNLQDRIIDAGQVSDDLPRASAQARSKRGEEDDGPTKHDQPTDQATHSEIPRTPRETPASTSVVGLAVPTEAHVLIRQATGMQPTANSERAGEATQGAMPSTARLATPGDEKALAKPLPDFMHARPNTLQEVETGDVGDEQTTLPRPANTMPRQLATQSATGAIGSGEDSPKVLRSETHLAPVAQLPPALQIAARVAEAVSTAEAPDSLPNPSDLTAARSLPQPLVKILHVALQPADLGTVVVRMSLRHDALDIQIDASRPGTVDLLQKDRDALSNVLKGSGYSIDGLSIQTLAPDRTGNSMIQQSASQASPSPSAQLQSGTSQSDGGWSRSRPQADDEQQRARGDGAAGGRSSGESQTSSLGIYV